PPLWTLQLLVRQVGPALIALTATSPLLQFAYARAAPARDPDGTFTASNAGSLAGLFAYPFVVEPLLTLDQQARAWQAATIVLVSMLAVGATALLRPRRGRAALP